LIDALDPEDAGDLPDVGENGFELAAIDQRETLMSTVYAR